MFLHIIDCLVVVPRYTFFSLLLKQLGFYGIARITAGIPSILHPFVIREKNLFAAVASLLASADPACSYIKPTTDVELTGYHAKLEDHLLISLEYEGGIACKAILRFVDKINRSGITDAIFCFNSLAPLFGDFYLIVAGYRLLIKHKSKSSKTLKLVSDVRNPFHRLR